jgi:hypothetical protein
MPLAKINNPSQITDLNRLMALTFVRGGGTGTNTITGTTQSLAFPSDMGLTQGKFVGTDGTDKVRDQMNTLAHDQAAALRIVRRALKLVGPQVAYVDSMMGHRVNPGCPLSVRPNQHLHPLRMARQFILFREQWKDKEALQSLVAFAAADIAQAEGAVAPLGSDAGPLLQKLNIELNHPSELEQQEGLFQRNQKEVANGDCSTKQGLREQCLPVRLAGDPVVDNPKIDKGFSRYEDSQQSDSFIGVRTEDLISP